VTTIDRDANILGALAVIVNDRTGNAVATAAGHSLSAAVALSALHHFLDRPTVDALGRVLGLTPSGAVRLVDRLAADGLVTRGPGADGRSRSLTLTRKGRRAGQQVSAARAAVLSGALAGLSTAERATLNTLLAKVLDTLVREKVTTAPGEGGWTFRLCDTTACGRNEGDCPVANSAAAALT
jgi:DNA-binding MarR family transcriptional regulator